MRLPWSRRAGPTVSVVRVVISAVWAHPWQAPQALSVPELPPSGHPHRWNDHGGNKVASEHLVSGLLSGGAGKDGHFLPCSDAPSWSELPHGMARAQQDHASDE